MTRKRRDGARFGKASAPGRIPRRPGPDGASSGAATPPGKVARGRCDKLPAAVRPAADSAAGRPPVAAGPPAFCVVEVRLRYPLFLSLFLLAFAKGRTVGEEAAAAVERHVQRARGGPWGAHVN